MSRRRSTRRESRPRDRHAFPRGRATLAVCTMVVIACGLAGCASHDGTDLARQACRHVDRSITLYQSSLHAPSPAAARAQQTQAVSELRAALPIASTAAGEAGQYQALMATLDESDHLPESLLVHALSLQSAAVGSDTGSGAPPPTAETPGTHPPPTGL